jgi:hypothetical protein
MARKHTPIWVYPLVFGMLGPPIGGTLLYLGLLGAMLVHPQPPSPHGPHWNPVTAIAAAWIGWVFFAAFSYVFGLIPAMVAALWAALTSRLPWWIYFIASALGGGLMSAYMPPSRFIPPGRDPSATELWLIGGLGGLVAAICAYLCRSPRRPAVAAPET